MISSVIPPHPKLSLSKTTLLRLYKELQQLKERVEDLEDLRDLNAAIARNKGKPLISWAKIKKELEISD